MYIASILPFEVENSIAFAISNSTVTKDILS